MHPKTLYIPTLEDIKKARERISKYILKTPLKYSYFFSTLSGAEVYIKYENVNPTCAFKVRSGINYILKLKEKNNNLNFSLLAGSTGNHGQSIAYCGKLFNIPVTIVVPENANKTKVKAMENLGAKIIFYGKDVFDVWEYCKELEKDKNYFFVPSVEEPSLFEGVGTIGLEVYEDLPDVDCFITALGGGSGLCGSSIALKSLNPKIKTYGIQSFGAPSVHDSFKNKKLITYPSLNTFAEGLATRNTFQYTLNILEKYVDDIFLVSDEELKKVVYQILENEKTLAEGAGAAALTGLVKYKELFKGKKVACVITGGNLQIDILKNILEINNVKI